MAFDGQKHIEDRLTVLEDQRKQAYARRDVAVQEAEEALAEIESEIAFWKQLVATPKPAAKKAAAPKK